MKQMTKDSSNLMTNNIQPLYTEAWTLNPGLSANFSTNAQSAQPGSQYPPVYTNVDPSFQYMAPSISPLNVSLRLFQSRAPLELSKSHGMSLLRRMLGSYAFMMLQKDNLPPFICPHPYSLAKERKGPCLEALTNCASLVQMFKTRTPANRDFVWRMIRTEQDRLWHQHHAFDRWGLVSSLQALLVYCLLRLIDQESSDNDFDVSLLATCHQMSLTMARREGNILMVDTPARMVSDSLDLGWEDWTYHESLRRTVLCFKILDKLVDISSVAQCTKVADFALIPLPGSIPQWTATNEKDWRADYELHFQSRTLHGVSDKGDLIKLQQRSSGIYSEIASWEDWLASVGDIGTVIMAMASLL
ncbi:hypothetical protein F5Y16DRAFT_383629 [Xylariaceae sp. FL0255]|nr:hypothetical protein F5Y16DRAFT_383629 [Xylariaceae sp. FL0255]